jgi:hypothetical protein
VAKAFVDGVSDNPYLTGLRMRPTKELSALVAQRVSTRESETFYPARGKAAALIEDVWTDKVLGQIAALAPEIVRAKVVKLLCPDFPFPKESFGAWLDSQVSGFVEARTGRAVNAFSDFNFEQMLVLLAHGAAMAEAKGGHADLAGTARQKIKEELAPPEARLQLADALLKGRIGPMSLTDHERAQEEAIRDISGKAVEWFDALRQTYLNFFAGIEFKQ